MTLDDIRTAATQGLDVLQQCLARLRALRPGSPPSARSKINMLIDTALTEIHLAEITAAHVKAAGVVVTPLDPEVEARLTELADRIDGTIRTNIIITAGLDMTAAMLREASELSRRLQGATQSVGPHGPGEGSQR